MTKHNEGKEKIMFALLALIGTLSGFKSQLLRVSSSYPRSL